MIPNHSQGSLTTLVQRNGQYIIKMSTFMFFKKDQIREIGTGPQRKVNIESEEASGHCTEGTLN